MAKPPIHLSRQDLYAEICSTPAEVLAERYGISGRGLGKICARLLVPVPPRGWWAKKNSGHKVTRIPLPNPRPNTPQEVEIRATEPPPAPAPLAPAVESYLVAVAHDPIPVPERSFTGLMPWLPSGSRGTASGLANTVTEAGGRSRPNTLPRSKSASFGS